MAIIRGIPNIAVFAVGAFAIYYFLIREKDDKKKDKTGVGTKAKT